MRARAGCGTVANYNRGCRCARCTAARRLYNRRRWAALVVVRGGAPQWKVDTAASRRALAELRSRGWSYLGIARATGLGPATLDRVRRAARCYSTTERALIGLAGR